MEGKDWCVAARLEAGDVFHTKDGQGENVVDVTVKKQEEPIKVYNLTIEDYYTYYVAEDDVLVHNDGCGSLTEDEIKESK